MKNSESNINILVVEDDEVDFITLKRAFKKCAIGVTLTRADTVEKAKNLLKTAYFQCVLLDYRLPDATGMDFLTSVEFSYVIEDIAVIMLTGEEDISIVIEALKNGAQDYIPKKSICGEILEISIKKAMDAVELNRQLEEKRMQIEELAFFDPLTGLPNRYVFEDRLQQLIRMAKRSKQTFMVGMMDLNRFKQINDTLGHQAGDEVLKIVAGRLSAILREGDTVARFGGDEYAMLLPENEEKTHIKSFEKRISDVISKSMLIEGKQVKVGISIGISQFPNEAENAKRLIKLADEALYREKNRTNEQNKNLL